MLWACRLGRARSVVGTAERRQRGALGLGRERETCWSRVAAQDCNLGRVEVDVAIGLCLGEDCFY